MVNNGNDYDVTVKIGVVGLDESDVENKLKHIFDIIDEEYGFEIISIVKVGEYV